MMKRFIVPARWIAVAGLFLAFGMIAVSHEKGTSYIAIFTITAGAVIGSNLLAPRCKEEVALLMSGIGMALSVTLFTVTPDRFFTATPSLLRVSVEWKESACGMIGSIVGLLIARKNEETFIHRVSNIGAELASENQPGTPDHIASDPDQPVTTPESAALSSLRPRNITEIIEERRFPGDDDETLRRVQILVHFDLIRNLERKARERFLEAADFVDLQNELVAAINGKIYMDPMLLMGVYGRIAAYYRFTSSASKQMELGQDAASHWQAAKIAWVRFYESEVQRLTDNGEITRAIVKTLVYHGTEISPLEKDRLDRLIEDRYGDLEVKARRVHRAGPVPPTQEEV